ncbi:unnamed protein product [Rotaria sp. Silwood2]|nr:unnamed protein product [Rotaria sp. Silwood2]CAF2880363.1 unnamed protein product [Rotaria sp. Silwood2]CAF3123010.1 unnamed protein product [Rotaria sp. Silwood2]CAF3351798.1 unnamed protein product [Rotaria sp. Silwood2]CAF3929792.1 unnamed protein product [Rotaria sp. Silwood2]
MSAKAYSRSMGSHEHSFHPSDEIIGESNQVTYLKKMENVCFEKASRLLMVGGGCLLIVLIFGIILCRLDISAGKRRRAQSFHQVES